jgi:uncharacterized membrane protein
MLANLFLYFIFGSFIGWAYEDLISLIRDHKIVNRGFLNGPYCPIYGFGALACLALNQITNEPIILFLVGGLAACIIEYITSYIMEKLFNARWWDYTNYPFNLNGRICLYGYLIFGAAAVLMSFVNAPIMAFINNTPHKTTIAIILLIILLIDVFTTNQSFARFNNLLREYQKTLKKGRVIRVIQRSRRRFEATILDRPRKVFTYQQRRILKAFPNFKSNYDRAFNELQKFYKKTKFKPISDTKQNAQARKKREKILK